MSDLTTFLRVNINIRPIKHIIGAGSSLEEACVPVNSKGGTFFIPIAFKNTIYMVIRSI